MEGVFNATFFGGDPVEVPYTLSDMAADAIGLVDALDCEVVDAVGVSMGGMIVQTWRLNIRAV